MTFLKQVKMVIMPPDGKPKFIPIEPIPGYPTIEESEKFGFWVHREEILEGASDGIGSHHMMEQLSQEHIDKILENDGICYVEVDYQGNLSCPGNALGFKKVNIFLEKPQEYVEELVSD